MMAAVVAAVAEAAPATATALAAAAAAAMVAAAAAAVAAAAAAAAATPQKRETESGVRWELGELQLRLCVCGIALTPHMFSAPHPDARADRGNIRTELSASPSSQESA
ncbi:hypothetical protein EMIHUDRAFT_447237 [Emiliania huxleyi CCMP1516]|uniref:Secreted protein n=2 Tax=Emiliania huxleyi TaxID=2903 RepID=A0A0D3JD05_EMIH1|nr:hypothetical protein EMIHUDRAFT_447237 [Emiliania huxleyi CCMP1516]EOD21390.1 hypothetical protein EMIHUDRAFT_447237 [Emiliania huxleyi CCMP1516]|eukprot:XP_005773819.1 hypothetical protein EMIHUDRAFT_447237 [Emiliania huxleyi CCMP1516]